MGFGARESLADAPLAAAAEIGRASKNASGPTELPPLTPLTQHRRTRRKVLSLTVAACCVMFAEGFAQTMLFPYASFMTEYLRGSNAMLGTMTGFIFTAFPVGCIGTAKLWGMIASSYGRRVCLLFSLSASTVLAVAMAFCDDYRFVLALRLVQGLVNCSLPMARTTLKERIAELQGDEVVAFSRLQASFGASVVAGPALGGLCYGWLPIESSRLMPWAAPQAMAFILYVSAFAVSYFWMEETGDLEISVEMKRQESSKVAMFARQSFRYLIIMVAGHSFVFTGWEVGYPLLARSRSGQDWTSSEIGLTFLVGSIGLVIHTLVTYPAMVHRLGFDLMWLGSWVPTVAILIFFPRIASSMLSSGVDTQSTILRCTNYGSQLFISVMQGANFITLQLMLNALVAAGDDKEYALPVANGWVVAVQALSRSISPVLTGTLARVPSPFGGTLGFDTLALVSIFTCLVPGYIHWRICSGVSRLSTTGKSAKSGGYKELPGAPETTGSH